jgi:hypothetical protein
MENSCFLINTSLEERRKPNEMQQARKNKQKKEAQASEVVDNSPLQSVKMAESFFFLFRFRLSG